MQISSAERTIGITCSAIARIYHTLLTRKLKDFPIDRYFYPLLIIGRRDGELTQQAVAEQAYTDKVTVVRLIDYLSENGLVERVANPADRRGHLLHLTKKGKQLLPDLESAFAEVEKIAFRGFDKAETQLLHKMLGSMLHNLKEEACSSNNHRLTQ